MLNLIQYFLCVIWAFKIYTEFVTCWFVWNYHLCYLTLYIDQCHFLTSLSDGIISMLLLMPVFYNYWWRITSFESSLVNKETRVIYIARVIKFSLFLELFRKSTLLVRYKLDRLQPPRVNQFYIRARLFGGYTRFIPLF